MCMACLEYIKGNLKLNEFKSALRESALEGKKDHVEEVQTILYDHPNATDEELKAKIQKVSGKN